MSKTAVCSPILAGFLVGALASSPCLAFDRDQWQGGTRGDGTYRLTCTMPECTTDTFLSFTLRPPNAVGSVKDYERTIAAAMPELEKRGIRAETSAATRSTIGRFTLYRAKRTLTLPDGRKQYYAAGMLVGSDLSVSLFGVAPRPEIAERNFEGLADHLARHPPKDLVDR
jgi:hypothetical protein